MIAYIMKYLNQDSLRQRDLSLSKEKKYSNLERNAHEYMSQPFRLISYSYETAIDAKFLSSPFFAQATLWLISKEESVRYKMRNRLDASALKKCNEVDVPL